MSKNKKKDEYTMELEKLASSVEAKYLQLRKEHEYYDPNINYDIQSLHATIGCRMNGFIKMKTNSYTSVEELLDTYYLNLSETPDDIVYKFLQDKECCQYFEIFMKRYFEKNKNELIKIKPTEKMYELWFGDNKHCYGLLITPTYREIYPEKVMRWENDQSEIRKVKFRYWSVAHILETGIITYNATKKIEFKTIDDLIYFYKAVFYDNSKSKYERAIMMRYFYLLKTNTDYNNIAFLIPELRFQKAQEHKYRLDFTVACAEESNKNIGFELSPDSTHAYTKDMDKKPMKR